MLKEENVPVTQRNIEIQKLNSSHFGTTDFRDVYNSEPIGGLKRQALYDPDTSRIIIATAREGVPSPPFYTDETLFANTEKMIAMKEYIRENRAKRNLKIDIYKVYDDHAELCTKACANPKNTYFYDYAWKFNISWAGFGEIIYKTY